MLGFDKLTELHNDWIIDMVRGKEDSTLLSHRGSYKTTCVSIAVAIIMTVYPNTKTMFMRKTDSDTKEIVTQVRKILLSPQWQYLAECIYGVPIRFTASNMGALTTNLTTDIRGAAQLTAMGTSSSITGKHYDRIFTDDIVNVQDRLSRAERERIKTVYQELQNIKNRGGRIYNTGTPWHQEDAISMMPNVQRYDCYSTGLITTEKLDELRQSMVPSLFAANYELRHIAAEDALFKDAPKFTDDATLLRDGIAHIDAAYGGEDYTALTCCVRSGDTLYMYGKLWHKHVDTILDAALADCERLMCGPIYCETNGDKGYLAKEITRRDAIARRYQEKQNKYIKISSYLRKWWPNIVWLRETDPEYIQQVLDYTETAEHDDAPDSAASICRILDKDNILF